MRFQTRLGHRKNEPKTLASQLLLFFPYRFLSDPAGLKNKLDRPTSGALMAS